MPEPSQVHIDTALTNVSVAYKNGAFISDIIAPPVNVKKQSDKYFVYDAARERLRETDDKRAPGAEAHEVDFALSADNYFCDDHALVSVIPDEERSNADVAIEPDIERTEFLTDKIALNKEIALADAILESSAIPGDTLSGTSQWSDYTNTATSDPVKAIEAKKADIQEAAQVAPNTLVLPYEVYQKVRFHPKVVEKIQYVRMSVATPQILAELFDVERVLVPKSFKNTAKRGQSAALSYIWGKNAMLLYVPPRPALRTVSFAYSFIWTAEGSVSGYLVESWRANNRKADMIRVQRYYDQKFIAPSACYLWKSAVA